MASKTPAPSKAYKPVHGGYPTAKSLDATLEGAMDTVRAVTAKRNLEKARQLASNYGSPVKVIRNPLGLLGP